MYNLLENGDLFEREGAKTFLPKNLPSYELFWQKFVVPLTGREKDILNILIESDMHLQLKFPSENIETIHERVAISQLHYSVFRMLFKAYNIKSTADKDLDFVESFFSHLYSALDISAELFARYDRLKNDEVTVTDPFDSKNYIEQSIELRKKWERTHPYPADISKIRKYRNVMMHGQMLPCALTRGARLLIIPLVGSENLFSDWRVMYEANKTGNFRHCLYSHNVVEKSFKDVVSFLESEWQNNLIIK